MTIYIQPTRKLVHRPSGERFTTDDDPMVAICAIARAVGFVIDRTPQFPGLYRLNGDGMVLELREDGSWWSPNGSRCMTDVAEKARTFMRLGEVAP